MVHDFYEKQLQVSPFHSCELTDNQADRHYRTFTWTVRD